MTKNVLKLVIDLECPVDVEIDVGGANKIAAELFYVLQKHVKNTHGTYRVTES